MSTQEPQNESSPDRHAPPPTHRPLRFLVITTTLGMLVGAVFLIMQHAIEGIPPRDREFHTLLHLSLGAAAGSITALSLIALDRRARQ